MPITKLRPSFTFTQDRLKELQAVVPEAFADGKVNWETLREALGDYVEDENQEAEHFGLNWPGKREARRLAAKPSKGTLVPVPGDGVSEETTRNVFIEGDNLEVLKLLQKSYAGRVKMIYIDPPYNTGNDFVYKDDFRDPLEDYLYKTEQASELGELLTSNPKASGRFHSNWLNMIYPRLLLARTLLRDDGVIFVSIDDNELHNLRSILDEIFGAENFIDCIVWKKRYGGGAKEKFLVTLHEYTLFYAKNVDLLDPIFIPNDPQSIERYYKFKDGNYQKRGPYRTHPLEATKSMGDRTNLVYPIPAPDGTSVLPKRQWLWSKERALKALQNKELEFLKSKDGSWTVHTKQYLKDESGEIRQSKAFSIIDDVFSQHGTNEILELFGDTQVFPFPKPTGFMRRLIEIGLPDDNDDIILDFFSGSCSTAHTLLQYNFELGGQRRFIMIQLPEPTDSPKFPTISEIGKERIRRVIKKIKNQAKGKLKLHEGEQDLGFKVLKLSNSNYRAWKDFTGDDVQQLETLFDSAETTLVKDWKPDNVLIETLLLEGFPLDSSVIPQKQYKQNKVLLVESTASAHRLFICIDPKIEDDTIEQLQFNEGDIFICLDTALTDESKVRLSDIGNLHVI